MKTVLKHTDAKYAMIPSAVNVLVRKYVYLAKLSFATNVTVGKCVHRVV